mmetsp:Transcript_36688/g.90962  ORF Transcript_36688/g.90962 Transcript_36688/m.90962 type:complete len:407 (-) Transcript_36688:1301-2521(-)
MRSAAECTGCQNSRPSLSPSSPPALFLSSCSCRRQRVASRASIAAWQAVNGVSPVIMTRSSFASLSALSTAGVSGLSGQARTNRPRKVRPRSQISRPSARASVALIPSGSSFEPNASTRAPRRANHSKSCSYSAGLSVKRSAITSGAPFASTSRREVLAPPTSSPSISSVASTDMRFFSDEKGLRWWMRRAALGCARRVSRQSVDTPPKTRVSGLSFANVQPTAASVARSIGSPSGCPCALMTPWQPARQAAASMSRKLGRTSVGTTTDSGAASMSRKLGRTSVGTTTDSGSSRTSPFATFVASPLSTMAAAGVAALVQTPSTIMLSDVSVPVLSKQHTSTFPAEGMRNGSVQYTPAICKARSEELTAKESSIGNSGGTTEVMTNVQWSSNLCLSLDSSAHPDLST